MRVADCAFFFAALFVHAARMCHGAEVLAMPRSFAAKLAVFENLGDSLISRRRRGLMREGKKCPTWRGRGGVRATSDTFPLSYKTTAPRTDESVPEILRDPIRLSEAPPGLVSAPSKDS